jgi:hypothetical protein
MWQCKERVRCAAWLQGMSAAEAKKVAALLASLGSLDELGGLTLARRLGAMTGVGSRGNDEDGTGDYSGGALLTKSGGSSSSFAFNRPLCGFATPCV